MKKKSLLIAMAAMSVAAIGAGTVSTMAWFTTTAAASTGADAASSSLTIDNHPASTVGAIKVKFTITFQEVTNFEASKVHLVNANGQEKVWQNGTLVSATSTGTNAYGKVTVTATGITEVSKDNGANWVAVSTLNSDEKSSLAGTYTYYVEGTGRSHVVAKGDAVPSSNYLTDLEDDARASFTITVDASGAFVSATSVTAVYTVDGSADPNESATENNDGATGIGTVSVTLNANFGSFAGV